MGPNHAGVYAITNKLTGSMYVGSAICIRRRWISHLSALKSSGKSPPNLQAAWNRYGEDAFAFSVLELCAPAECLVREQHYIDLFRPAYNTRARAESNFGVRWAKETNLKKGRPEKLYTVQGISAGLHTLCKHFGVVTKQCAQWRMSVKGMSVEEAVLTPPTPRKSRGVHSAAVRKATDTGYKGANLEFRGVRGSVAQLARLFSPVSYYTVRSRLHRGWSLEAALLTPLQRGSSD